MARNKPWKSDTGRQSAVIASLLGHSVREEAAACGTGDDAPGRCTLARVLITCWWSVPAVRSALVVLTLTLTLLRYARDEGETPQRVSAQSQQPP